MQSLRIKIQNYNLKLILILVVGYWLLVVGQAKAQTPPEFLVSWRALNYVPADYQGKIFPTKSTRVEAAFDLIDKNKVADLSRNEIAWYLNNNFLRSGVGLKTIAFDVPNNLD